MTATDAPRRAGRGAATPNGEMVMTDLIDTPLRPLTQAGRDYMAKQLDAAQRTRASLAANRDDILREAASLDRCIHLMDRTIAMVEEELGGPVSLLPSLDAHFVEPTPDEQLPCERVARAAVEQQDPHAGHHPYDPATLPWLPRVEGAVQVNGTYPSEPVSGGAR